MIKDVIKHSNRGILLRETTKKITRSEGGFLNFLKSLMLAGLSFMKNVLTPFTKSILFPLGFATAATDLTIQKTIFGSGATLIIIYDEEMKDIIKIVKSLEDSGLLIEGVSKTYTNKAKEPKGRVSGILLGKLGTTFLGNKLAGKGVLRAGEWTIAVGKNN